MTETDAAAWVGRFEHGWAEPDPDAFFAGWAELLHPDVRLVQPLVPPSRGFDAFRREFGRLRALIPDLHVEVRHWAHGRRDDGMLLFIEFDLVGSIGREGVRVPCVDRFLIDEQGLATERVATFDPTVLAGVIARHPRAWGLALRGLRRG